MNVQKEISIIFFDLFGVLLGSGPSVFIQYLSQLTETPYLRTKTIIMGKQFKRFERGEINFNNYVNEICADLPNGSRINETVLHNIWSGSSVGAMPAVTMLDKLQHKHFVWIISNTKESHINELKLEFNFLNRVDGIITSEEAGAHKPSPAIYNYALTRAGTDSFSSLFIDDSPVNVKAAEDMGFQVHRYINYEQFIYFLNDFL